MNRLTVTVEECGCPAGRFRASAPRAGVFVWNDDPFEAQREALEQAIDLGEFAYTPAEYDVESRLTDTFDPPASTFSQPPG